MTEDLIKRLREYEVHIEKQAKRIAELEVALKNDNLAYRQGLHDGLDERDELCAEIRKLQDASRMWDFEQMKLRKRAEKAEADLAAARDALRSAESPSSEWDRRHSPAIAAARSQTAEQPSPEKSCETCKWCREEGPTSPLRCSHGNGDNCGDFTLWQQKTDVCPTCKGTKTATVTAECGCCSYEQPCPACGTGKKETK